MRYFQIFLTLLCVFGASTWLLLSVIVPETDAEYVVLQSRQDTCGPASAATLLNFYLNCPTTEAEMIRLSGSSRGGDSSLLDLQRAVEQKHCAATSCKMTLAALQQQLETFAAPIIVRFHAPSPHFSVLLGMDADSCCLADPTLGNVILSRRDMARMWLVPGDQTGYALVVAPKKGVKVGRVRQVMGELHVRAQRLTPQAWCANWVRRVEYGF